MKKDSLEKKLAAYVTLAAAYMAAHPVEANAQVLYTDVNPDVVINSGSFFNLDLNQDSVDDIHFVEGCNTSFVSYGSSGSITINRISKAFPMGAVAFVRKYNAQNCAGNPIPLDNGAPVGVVAGELFGYSPTLNHQHGHGSWSGGYSTSTNSGSGCFYGATDKFLGVRLTQNGLHYYGWVRLSLFNCTITVKDCAIKLNPNSNLQAGVVPACPIPGNLHITNLTNHSAKLNWNTQSQAIGYQVQYRKTGTSGWLIQSVNANVGYKNISNLLPNTSYDWRVRTVCQQNPTVQSAYTVVQTFATPLRMEDEAMDTSVTGTGNELFIFPNPAGNEIHLLIGDGGDYELKIFNMLGQQVAAEKINLAEDQSVTVNTSTLTTGTYQIIVTSNEGNFTGRFVKE